MRLWKLYITIIVSGILIWIISLFLYSPDQVVLRMPMNKSLTPYAEVVPPVSIYGELKFWAEIIGKSLMSIGGLASIGTAAINWLRARRKS